MSDAVEDLIQKARFLLQSDAFGGSDSCGKSNLLKKRRSHRDICIDLIKLREDRTASAELKRKSFHDPPHFGLSANSRAHCERASSRRTIAARLTIVGGAVHHPGN